MVHLNQDVQVLTRWLGQPHACHTLSRIELLDQVLSTQTIKIHSIDRSIKLVFVLGRDWLFQFVELETIVIDIRILRFYEVDFLADFVNCGSNGDLDSNDVVKRGAIAEDEAVEGDRGHVVSHQVVRCL